MDNKPYHMTEKKNTGNKPSDSDLFNKAYYRADLLSQDKAVYLYSYQAPGFDREYVVFDKQLDEAEAHERFELIQAFPHQPPAVGKYKQAEQDERARRGQRRSRSGQRGGW